MQSTSDKDLVIVLAIIGEELAQPQSLARWVLTTGKVAATCEGTAATIWPSWLRSSGNAILLLWEFGDEACFDEHARLKVHTVTTAIYWVVS